MRIATHSLLSVATIVLATLPALATIQSNNPPPLDRNTGDLLGVLSDLHAAENQVLRDLALGSLTQKKLKKVIDLIKLSGGPGCDPGYCPQGGICVPCEPPTWKPPRMSDRIRLLASLATLHMAENQLINEFVSGSASYKSTLEKLRTLAGDLQKEFSGHASR